MLEVPLREGYRPIHGRDYEAWEQRVIRAQNQRLIVIAPGIHSSGRAALYSAYSCRGQPLSCCERRRDQQGLSLWQRWGRVVVIKITALVVAVFPFIQIITICAPLIPVGDRPSPTADAGISRVCPSGSRGGGLW